VQTAAPDLQNFADRYTAAWCSQNAAQVAAFFSPNGRLSVNDSAPAVGRDAIQITVQSFMTAFPDLQVILDNLVVKTDRVEYHWTLVGTNTGPGGTGKRVRISGMENWKQWSDGLIAVSEGEFDATDYQRQLGLTS
jgi:predicted ester cyclase